MSVRKQRVALREAINHVRAATHILMDAHLSGSVDETRRLSFTLSRHLDELTADELRLERVRAKHERVGGPDEQQLADMGLSS